MFKNKKTQNIPNQKNPLENIVLQKKNIDKIALWDTAGRMCLYLLFGLVPIFFLPITSFPVNENKSVLAVLLILSAFACWLVKVLNLGKIVMPRTKVWIFAVLFLAVAGVSTFLSGSFKYSLWGYAGSSDSLFHLFIYALALFLAPLFLRDTAHLIKAVLLFSISLCLVSVFSLLQMFGVFTLPFDFTKSTAFNPIGNPQSLAIFLGSGLVMIIALISSFKLSAAMKFVFSAAAALLGFILLLVNYNYVWLGILIASVLVVSWQVMNNRVITNKRMFEERLGADPADSISENLANSDAVMNSARFGLPIVLMILVAILFFVKPPISNIVKIPVEVRPSLTATISIAKESLRQSLTNAVFGSGPSTFTYEYLKFRPQELNATAFWNTRFTQGFSAISTMLITLGIAGVGALLLLFGSFVTLALRGITIISSRKLDAGRLPGIAEKISLISFVSFLFIMLFWFIYPINLSIYLFTFLFMGLVIASLNSEGWLKNSEFSFAKSPQLTFAVSSVIIVFVVAVVVGGYSYGQKYAASIFHSFAIETFNRDKNIDGAIKKVQAALNLDSSRDIYWRTFSDLLTLKTRELLNSGGLDKQDVQARYQLTLQGLIQAAQNTANANPFDPLNWRALASVYESNARFVGGAEKFAIKNYEEAAARNPKNPEELLNLARSYILAADILQQGGGRNIDEGKTLEEQRVEYLNKARDSLQKAISLKSDYSPAHFMISQVYERLGERQLAIQKNLEARNLNPSDTGVGYQLGLLYYLDNQIQSAQFEFERVVGLNSNFSNARYFLGLIYDRLGSKNAAVEQFLRIEELNPDNQEVERILSNLRSGRNALAEISPPAALPEERLEAPIANEEIEE